VHEGRGGFVLSARRGKASSIREEEKKTRAHSRKRRREDVLWIPVCQDLPQSAYLRREVRSREKAQKEPVHQGGGSDVKALLIQTTEAGRGRHRSSIVIWRKQKDETTHVGDEKERSWTLLLAKG